MLEAAQARSQVRPTLSPSPDPKGAAMAKGQKKTNKEVRKPKTAKAKPAEAARSFLTPPPIKK